MKKKTTSCMLALSLIASSIPVSAAGPIQEANNFPKMAKTQSDLVGNIEADINFALPILSTSKDSTTLKLIQKSGKHSADLPLGFEGESKTGEVTLGSQKIKYEIKKFGSEKTSFNSEDNRVFYYKVEFKDLPVGQYALELSGAGFKTVEVGEIDLTSYSKRVVMSNQESFLFGDFDGDGKVTDADYQELSDHLETDVSALIKKYDLNRDGVVDVTDLSYVHENVDLPIKNVKIEETNPIIDTSAMKLEGNLGDGSKLEDLFTDEKNVYIKPDKDEAISEDNPAKVELSFPEDEPVKMEEIVIDSPGTAAGKVVVNGEEFTFNNKVTRTASKSNATVDENGTIKVNLGKQVAVKKITIVVTETTDRNTKLADIAKVEFLNNVYQEIPVPEMDIPVFTVTPSSEELTVQWGPVPNVTGYEVKAVGEVKGKEKEFILQTASNSVTFTGLENYNEYKISMQSMNGEWTSGYSEIQVATPKPQGIPEPPEGVSIEGLYKGLKVTWKKHKNADTFNLYYKKANSDEEFTAVENLKTLSYTIANLEDNTEYDVYLTATNEHGTSGKSQTYSGFTANLTAPISSNYKLINTSNGLDEVSNHIVDVEYPKTNLIANSEKFNKFDIVDNDYSSAWTHNDWDTSSYSKSGPIITLDQEFTIDTVSLVARLEPGYSLPYLANIGVFNEETGKWEYSDAHISTKNNNGNYATLKIDKPLKGKKFQVNTSVYAGVGTGKVSISELKLYEYDSLENEVRDLFKDDLLIELKSSTKQEKINELRNRANTEDTVSGEFHPNQKVILEELQLAEDMLNDKKVSSEVMTVNQNITNSGNNLGMANDWQALGLSVRAKDEIVVYVGTEGNTLPELAFTQHYGESGKYIKTQKLQKGKNVIEVPEIHDMKVEKGGSIYVRYPKSSPSNKDIKIRVTGATKIPHLNVFGMINDEAKETEVKEAIKTYINDLKVYVSNLPSLYSGEEDGSKNKYAYDEKTSVLNTTDIETDKVTLNQPATAILKGITSGLSSIDEQVDRVYKTLQAHEQIMDLKYAERGVTTNPDFDGNGKLEGNELLHVAPKSRMNIKYQRMFIGAFMYASGHHVGIEYGSAAGLMQGVPYTFNEDGTVKTTGKLFGWGIAHEIGHVTDPGNMTYAETTNNVIALLAQTLDDEAKSRLETSEKYEDVYEKVTSGTVSLPSDVFVKLGMFWQLHLAYDENPTAKMLQTDSDKDPKNDSFYARYSKLLRENKDEYGKYDQEQRLVLVASDAAGKDLSDFFYAWGIRPNAATKKYLEDKGYEKETRKIQYINDEARRQTLAKKGAVAEGTTVSAEYANGVKANTIIESKDITLDLGVSQDSDKVLGYEIYRNGKVVGFTTEDTYTDSLGATNNRVVKYDVVAYDYELNKIGEVDLGSIKVSHTGVMDKNGWSVETNTTNDEDKNDENDIAHGPVLNPSIDKAIDNKSETVYTGEKAEGGDDPYVIVDMNENQPIVGIGYTDNTENAITNYEVYVSNNKKDWTLAKSGEFENPSQSETVYFNKPDSTGGKQLATYYASYVKLVAKGAEKISIGEIDIIAPPGDNIEIGTKKGNYQDGFGILSKEYVYGDKEEGEVIPKGSFIITGEYRGNPAFNITKVINGHDKVLSTETILLAEIPDNAELGEISNGTYITWIAPKDGVVFPTEVMLEMYRVDGAVNLEGERLVSDTLYSKVPADLPNIEFGSDENLRVAKKVSVYKDFKKIK